MSSTRPRGNALVFVLLLIAVIMLIVYAGTTLQPLEAKALDQHLNALSQEALLDSAIEEALANLQAGRSPEFSREFSINGQSAQVTARQSRTTTDAVTLEITSTLPHAENESRAIRVELLKSGQAWRRRNVDPRQGKTQ